MTGRTGRSELSDVAGGQTSQGLENQQQNNSIMIMYKTLTLKTCISTNLLYEAIVLGGVADTSLNWIAQWLSLQTSGAHCMNVFSHHCLSHSRWSLKKKGPVTSACASQRLAADQTCLCQTAFYLLTVQQISITFKRLPLQFPPTNMWETLISRNHPKCPSYDCVRRKHSEAQRDPGVDECSRHTAAEQGSLSARAVMRL